jgi:hypothetical protein
MHIHGAKTPFEYVQKNAAYRTSDISLLLQ